MARAGSSFLFQLGGRVPSVPSGVYVTAGGSTPALSALHSQQSFQKKKPGMLK